MVCSLLIIHVCYICSAQFPFFCSDREYVIGRRIWESEGSYYCVTKVASASLDYIYLVISTYSCYHALYCNI